MACNEVIYKGKTYTDDEFKKYLADLIGEIKGVYKHAFAIDPMEALRTISDQAYSSPSEKAGAISAVGQELVDMSQELFPQKQSRKIIFSEHLPNASQIKTAHTKYFNKKKLTGSDKIMSYNAYYKENAHVGNILKNDAGISWLIEEVGNGEDLKGDPYLGYVEDGIDPSNISTYTIYPIEIRDDGSFIDLTDKIGPKFDIRPEVLGEQGYKVIGKADNNTRDIFLQTADSEPAAPVASPKVLAAIRQFNAEIGVTEESVKAIVVNGRKLNANEAAFAYKGLVQVVEGKEAQALVEGSMHIAVAITEQTNPKLFNDMLKDVNNHPELQQTIDTYKSSKLYQLPNGKPDMVKLKKEAIAKVLTRVFNDVVDEGSNQIANAKTRSLWQRILDWLKKLFSKAQVNPFREAAEQVAGKKEFKGTADDVKTNKEDFLQRNKEAVDYQLSGIKKLSDNIDKAKKWETQIKDKEIFFKKLQQDLGIPKDQLALIKERYNGDIVEAMTSVAADMTYTVEVKKEIHTKLGDLAYGEVKEIPLGDDDVEYGVEIYKSSPYEGFELYDIQFFPTRDAAEEFATRKKEEVVTTYEPTKYYENLTVPGGTDYEEHDIRVPGVIPTIHSHAEFANDNSIGWFRSDSLSIGDIKQERQTFAGGKLFETNTDIIPGESTTTRRVLEVQSDLFQKGRDKTDLTIGTNRLPTRMPRVGEDVIGNNGKVYTVIEFYPGAPAQFLHDENQWEPAEPGNFVIKSESGSVINVSEDDLFFNFSTVKKSTDEDSKKSSQDNQFLQLLNKEGAWIGYFAKVIMQDSFRKGYERVRFPAGDTAAKVEGHETIAGRIKTIDKDIDALKKPPFWVIASKDGSGSHGRYETREEAEKAHAEDTNPFVVKNRDEFIIQPKWKGHLDKGDTQERIIELERERERYKTEGLAKIAPIAHFYEVRLKNTLDKIYGKANVGRVTDEHGNDWFEIGTDSNRDSEIFLQINPDDTYAKIEDLNSQIVKAGSKYSINGVPIKYSVDTDVIKDLEKKFKTHSDFQTALAQWRREKRVALEQEIGYIAKRYIDNDGFLKETYGDAPQTSSIDPEDLTFVNTLDKWFKDKFESYPANTQFVVNKSIYNAHLDKAGFANFIAIYDTTGGRKIDILQFKITTPPADVHELDLRIESTYRLEVQGLRDILSKAYAVPSKDFGETRAIPIRVDYGAPKTVANEAYNFYIKSMSIGNVNAPLEKDLSLLPVPTLTETTGDKEIDKLIKRFQGLAELINNQKASKGEEHIKKERLLEMYTAIRKLQINKSASDLLSVANRATKAEESSFPDLKKLVEETDPHVAQYEGINELSGKIALARERLLPYADLGESFEAIYGTDDKEGNTNEATKVSNRARSVIGHLNRLEDYNRTHKLAAVTGIADELKPERNITWVRKYLLPLSKGTLKSQGQLWKLVEYTTTRYHLRYSALIKEIKALNDAIKAAGITADTVKKIFEYDDKGRWTGNVVQKIGKNFFQSMNKALRDKDIESVRNGIDQVAYQAWYDEQLPQIEEYAKHNITGKAVDGLPATEEGNAQARKYFIENWKDRYDIKRPSAANPANGQVFRFPKDHIWDSPEYNELKNNPQIFALYNFWNELVNRASEAGMFENPSDKYGFFPHIRKPWLEKASTKGGLKAGIVQPWASLVVRPEDETFGEFDPVSYKPINRVHANYTRDLGRRVEDTDGSFFKDYADVSQDYAKSMFLFAGDLIKYELRTKTEEIAKMIVSTESRLPSIKGGKSKEGEPRTIPNNANIDAIIQYVATHWYDQRMSGEDLTIEMNVGKMARVVNGILHFQFMVTPEVDVVNISLVKLANQFAQYFRTKTLGVSIPAAISNLFGGTANAFINAGDYFNRVDLLEAYHQLASSNSWGDEAGKIRAGLLSAFDFDPNTHERVVGRKLSTHKAIRWLTSDQLYLFMRGSDVLVNKNVGLALFANTLYQDGKLINIVQKVREENDYDNIRLLPASEQRAKQRKIAAEIEDLKRNSPDLLTRVSKLDKDGNLVLPEGLSEGEMAKFSQQIIQLNKEMLGNMNNDDMSIYHRYMFGVWSMMFKNWMPELIYKRAGPLELNFGTGKWNIGRTRSFAGIVAHHGLEGGVAVVKQILGNGESLMNVLKKDYERRKQYHADRGEDFPLTFGQFANIQVKAAVSGFKEIGLALGLLGMYYLLKSLVAEDKEADHTTKGIYAFTLKTIDRLQNEISFFYDPTSFTSIVNGNVFPAIALATDAEKLFHNVMAYGFYQVSGNSDAANKIQFMRYIYKDVPIAKEWVNYQAIWSAEFAKEHGIIFQNQSGVNR